MVKINQMYMAKALGVACYGSSHLLQQVNVDAGDFFRRLGLPEDIERSAERALPFDTFIELLEQLKRESLYSHPGLWLAFEQHHKLAMPYLELMRHSPNVEVVLQTAQQYRHIFSEITYWDWWTDSDYLFVKRCSFAESELNDKEHALYALAGCFLVLEAVLGDASQIEYVSLMQQSADGQAELERFFKTSIHYQQEFDGFVLKKHRLNQHNMAFDKVRYAELISTVMHQKTIFPDNLSFTNAVKRLIASTLSTHHCTIESVATMLHVHHRTVQNRLNKEGTNFKQLINEVRINIAKRLLMQQQLPLTQIADILGYSEASAFTRGFKQQLGCSPRVWRKLKKGRGR